MTSTPPGKDAAADQSRTASANPGEEGTSEEFVLLASVASRGGGERLVMSLGHRFRATARKGKSSALVVSANPDGSLKLTESRVQTASNLSAAALRVTAALMTGFLGVVSTLKGGKETVRTAQMHEGNVGADEHAAHALLAEAGANSAIVLVRCHNHDLVKHVQARAADRATHTWHGSMTEFRATLNPGPEHDWVREALDKKAG